MRTIGRFVWEHFTAEHVAGAREAFDVVYSLTRAEQERYGELGIETPYVHLGLPPGADRGRRRGGSRAASGERRAASGRQSVPLPRRLPRPPQAARAGARGVRGDHRRPACGCSSRPRSSASSVKAAAAAAERDPRIELRLADQPTAEHLRELASCDVCLAPARWEGLGLPLYEAIAFGMPAITNDAPPMNEAIHDGINGLLVASHPERNRALGDPGA